MVIDVTGPVEIARHAVLAGDKKKPSRFFIDLKPIDAKTFEKSKDKVFAKLECRKTPIEKPRVVAKAAKKGLSKINHDRPGHGGVDPGALAFGGHSRSGSR